LEDGSVGKGKVKLFTNWCSTKKFCAQQIAVADCKKRSRILIIGLFSENNLAFSIARWMFFAAAKHRRYKAVINFLHIIYYFKIG
jgi:hypothetical protein